MTDQDLFQAVQKLAEILSRLTAAERKIAELRKFCDLLESAAPESRANVAAQLRRVLDA